MNLYCKKEKQPSTLETSTIKRNHQPLIVNFQTSTLKVHQNKNNRHQLFNSGMQHKMYSPHLL